VGRVVSGLRAAVAALIGLLVVSTVTTSDASAAQQQPGALTEEQIQRALLTLADLPSGFMQAPGVSGAPPASETGGVCNGPNVFAVAQKAKSSASGTVNFYNANPDGPYVSEVVFAFPSVAGAKQFMKAAKRQVAQCKTGWSTSTSPDPADPPTDWTIELRPIAKIGEQRFADRAEGTGGGDDITRDPDLPRINDDAVVRAGNHVALVTRFGISEVVGSGRAELEDLAKKAVKQVEQEVLLNTKSG
jgi:PknH-like extracellular domain